MNYYRLDTTQTLENGVILYSSFEVAAEDMIKAIENTKLSDGWRVTAISEIDPVDRMRRMSDYRHR